MYDQLVDCDEDLPNKLRNQKNGMTSSSHQSKIFFSNHKTKLLSLLNSDRAKDKNYCDVTIKVDEKEYPAHKCVLGSLSDFFHRMFTTEMKERYDSVANINGVESEVMETVLDFAYTASVKLNEENVMKILIAADYFQMHELKKCCVACLGESLNKTNCLDIKLSGQMFNCPALSDTAETLAAQNFEEVVHQVQFKELDKNEAVKFLSSRDQKAFGSKEVYEGVLSWVYHDFDGRKENFDELFKLVKLHLLSTAYLEEVFSHELVKTSHECQDYLQKELLYRLKLPNFESKATTQSVQKDNMELMKTPVTTVTSSPCFLLPCDPTSVPSKKQSKQAKNSKKSTPIKDVNSKRSILPSIVDASTLPFSSEPANNEKFSKELVRILRHGKYSDIVLEPDGFVDVNKILQHKVVKKNFGNKSFKDLKKLVSDDPKKRFELKLSAPIWKIRATYGHTVPDKTLSKKERKRGKDTSQNSDCQMNKNSQVNTCSNENLNGEVASNISPGSVSIPYPGDSTVLKELIGIFHDSFKEMEVNSDGYVNVLDILKNEKFRASCGDLSIDDLEYIVESNGKKYFQMTRFESEWKIKALHEHFVPVDHMKLTTIADSSIEFAYHVTSHEGWQSIQKTGLSKMKRSHIHFHPGIPTKSLATKNKKPNRDVAVVINIAKARQAGFQFYTSDDQTILCPGDAKGWIPISLFDQVYRLQPFWKKIS